MSQAPLNPTIPYFTEEELHTQFNRQIDISYLDFANNTAVATVTILLRALAEGDIVGPVGFELITPFVSSDGSLANFTVSAGDTGSTTAYMAAKELLASGYITAFISGTLLAAVATDTLNLTFISTTGHYPSTMTAGLIRFYYKHYNPTQD